MPIGARKFNGEDAELKALLRKRVANALPDDARVLECHAGVGLMWRRVWHRFHGVAIEQEEDLAQQAMAQRTAHGDRWTVYQGDSLRLIECGSFASLAFDAIDIDPFGSPWKWVKAWGTTERNRAPVEYLVLTDGYASRRALAAQDQTLFGKRPRQNISWEEYLDTIDQRLSEWFPGAEVSRASYRPGGMMMCHHLLRITRA